MQQYCRLVKLVRMINVKRIDKTYWQTPFNEIVGISSATLFGAEESGLYFVMLLLDLHVSLPSNPLKLKYYFDYYYYFH